MTKRGIVKTLAVARAGVAVWALLASSASLAQESAATQPATSDPAKLDPQDAQAQAADAESPQDIVVTGTLLRGSAPVGSNLISVGQERFESQGATTTNELLATIPQVTNFFNAAPAAGLSLGSSQIQVVRPNLRNLSSNTAASAATLVLVDGHRLAGIGVKQSTLDPDLIPQGAIERVEVVTEGGSSTYGADAVGGVINFITRRKFDGVKVDARYGFADEYWTAEANALVGKDWGTGSLYAAYSFSKNDAIFGRDRDYIRAYDYSFDPAVPADIRCNVANVTPQTLIPGFPFPIPGATVSASGGAANRCDRSEDQALLPAQERHGAVVSLTQELGSAFTIDARAFYGRRQTNGTDTLRGQVTLTPANPYYALPPGVTAPFPGATVLPQVNFSFAPALGIDSAPFGTTAQEWGANVEVRTKLGDNFQLRSLLNYSRSNTTFFQVDTDVAALTAAGSATTAETAINPFNVAATSPAVLAAIANNEQAGEATDELFNLREVLDGRLFTLPGGEVRAAAGYEFLRDNFKQRNATAIDRGTLGTMPFSRYSRDVHAVFGELQVPIFGAENRTGGLYSLVLSGSVRYDYYDDFGGTTNPKFGVTYKPVDWFSLRGNWGTSFNAPAPIDQLGSATTTLTSFPFIAFTRPGDDIGFTGGTTVAIQGSRPNLTPQTAKTWSVGGDLEVPFARNLRASLTYYNVKFENLLGSPTPSVRIFEDFPNAIVTNVNGLSAEQLRAFAALVPGGSAVIEPLIASNTLVYEAVDFRVGNYGRLEVDGLDFALNYNTKTSFGGIDASVSGNYQLNRTLQSGPAAAPRDDLAVDLPRLLLQGTLGATVGKFRAQATWNHTSGYDLTPVTTDVTPQTHLGAFDTVNLFFKYDVPADSGVFKSLSFTANVNNVADQDPPALYATGRNGYSDFFSIGRTILLGVSKQF